MRAFIDRLRPAAVGGGFSMEGYFVWCGSPIRGDDGRYHLFASRWPQDLAFHPHWLTNSEIVRATAANPEGPYEFAEVVLPPRGEQWWDGRVTHNPTIHKIGDRYLLFYTGMTYSGPTPTRDAPVTAQTPAAVQAHASQRIGYATAPSLEGPWTRSDQPVLWPRPGRWDSLMVTNPAPCVLPDGRILLIYKSTTSRADLLRLGVAMADRLGAEFVRLSEEPILRFDDTGDHVEDPYLWIAPGGGFELIMKDMGGGITGEPRAGIHARSADGVHWQVSDPPMAYSRTVSWSDGSQTRLDFVDRPQLLIQDGVPSHLFLAAGMGGETIADIDRSWSMVIPLAR